MVPHPLCPAGLYPGYIAAESPGADLGRPEAAHRPACAGDACPAGGGRPRMARPPTVLWPCTAYRLDPCSFPDDSSHVAPLSWVLVRVCTDRPVYRTQRGVYDVDGL